MSTETRTLETIDAEIERLKKEYDKAEGTPTEIYTRIVGYYRSVKNWNKGKKEEYRYRRLFCEPSNMIIQGTGITGSAEEAVPEIPAILTPDELPSAYLYFYRPTCPNCPPVKEFVEEMRIEGEMINVDTDEGMTAASQYAVMAAPTVIFFDAEGKEMLRVHNAGLLRELFANTAVCA